MGTGNLCSNYKYVVSSVKGDGAFLKPVDLSGSYFSDITSAGEPEPTIVPYYGVFVYDKETHDLINHRYIQFVNSVWANEDDIYIATDSGISVCDITNISGSLVPAPYK